MDTDPHILLDFVSLITVLMVLHYEFSRKRSAANQSFRFRALLVCVALILSLDMLAWRMNGGAFNGARTMLYIVNSVYYVSQIVYCWLWVLFAHDWTGLPDVHAHKVALVISMLPMLAEFVMLLLNPFTGWVFVIDAGNLYARGSGYLPNLIPYMIYIVTAVLIILYAYITVKDEEIKRHNITLCVYMMLPIFGSIMEAFNFGVPWTWPLTSLSLR